MAGVSFNVGLLWRSCTLFKKHKKVCFFPVSQYICRISSFFHAEGPGDYQLKKPVNMGILCTCPLGAELQDITIEECPEIVGQIQKLVFQRRLNSGALNSFTIASANPNLLASWTPKLAASDDTKVVQTPFINAPVTEPGGPRPWGGGNQTRGGVEIIVGREPTTFQASFINTSQKSIKDLKTFFCDDVVVYFIDEYGRIIGQSNDIDSPTLFYGIPVANFSLFVGDKKFGGFEEPDQNMLEFKLYPNWSDNLYIVTPTNFNALNDLATP